MLRPLTDEDRAAFLKALETDPGSWPILRMQRQDDRLHMYYACRPDGVATLRAELNGAEVYHRTLSVGDSADRTIADLRAEVRRFRQEHAELGWDELSPVTCVDDPSSSGG